MIADKELKQISLRKPGSSKDPTKDFTFDAVFPLDSSQRAIYEESVFTLVESVLEGYNGITSLNNYRNYICLRTNRLWENVHNDWIKRFNKQ